MVTNAHEHTYSFVQNDKITFLKISKIKFRRRSLQFMPEQLLFVRIMWNLELF